MSATDLINRLEGVRQTGHGRWVAKCPCHEDRRPSLAITEKSDGAVLINDFGGCGAAEVLAAVGLDFSVLFPPRADWECSGKAPRRERATLAPADALALVAEEALFAALIASDIARGADLTEEIRARLWSAAGRISAAIEATKSSREVRHAV